MEVSLLLQLISLQIIFFCYTIIALYGSGLYFLLGRENYEEDFLFGFVFGIFAKFQFC